MSEQPTTKTGRRIRKSVWENSAIDLRAAILAIEDEAREQERAYWRRTPGSYRLDDGSLEVIVDLPESLSFLQDEFPDELAEVRRLAVAAERERLRELIDPDPEALLLREDVLALLDSHPSALAALDATRETT